MAKTRVWFGEQVLNELQNSLRNSDEKIDIREVYIRLDALVNQRARAGYFENWKLRLQGVDESYVTTWETVTVTDQSHGQLSYLTLPTCPVELPNNEGIVEICPKKYYLTGNNHSVIIMSRERYRSYNSGMAASMQGRLAGYRQGMQFIFTQDNVKKQYGDMLVRLAIRDSSFLSDTDVYPIPADKEQEIIAELVKWFMDRKNRQPDLIRDGIDQP